MDRIGPGTAFNAGPLVIKLDGPATTALLRGEAVRRSLTTRALFTRPL
jgi:hypothetical protein